MGRWIAFALAACIVAASLWALITARPSGEAHPAIDDRSRSELERVLRDAP